MSNCPPQADSNGTPEDHYAIIVESFSVASLAFGALHILSRIQRRYWPSADQLQQFNTIVAEWRAFMETLVGERRVQFERAYPNFYAHMERELASQEQTLRVLAIELRGADTWSTLNPMSPLAQHFRTTRNDVYSMDASFRTTTQEYRAAQYGVSYNTRSTRPSGSQGNLNTLRRNILGQATMLGQELADVIRRRTAALARLPRHIQDVNIRNAVQTANTLFAAVVDRIQQGLAEMNR
ncbi:hypothetical protein BD414DRAFT_71809 [Trametes punicea]|nr:hypothetical protein BD414DRAFT_71809 [Trametes punicea]